MLLAHAAVKTGDSFPWDGEVVWEAFSSHFASRITGENVK